MLSTKVKASSLTHLTDARYFAAWEVEWLGFQMVAGTDDFLPPQQIAAFQEWVDGVKICGEFGLAAIDELNSAITLLGLHAIQVGMFTPLATIMAVKEKVEVLQELVVESYSDPDDLENLMAANHGSVDYFILQCSKGGIQWSDIEEGTPFTVEQLKTWAAQYSILLDVHIDQSLTASQLVETIGVNGFAVTGGEEEKVGLKNFDELDDFFESLEVLV